MFLQEKLNRRPYIPRNVYFLKWIEDETNSIVKHGDNTRRCFSIIHSLFCLSQITVVMSKSELVYYCNCDVTTVASLI